MAETLVETTYQGRMLRQLVEQLLLNIRSKADTKYYGWGVLMNKSKFKYILIAVILLFGGVLIYQNYLYYIIPHNPLAEIDHEVTPTSFYFSENDRNDGETTTVSTQELDTTTRIFEYLSNLNLVPLNKKSNEEKFYSDENIYYSGMFRFKPSSTTDGTEVHINEIYIDNLSVLHISSRKRGFEDGYYEIVDDQFDYEYIKELIANSGN